MSATYEGMSSGGHETYATSIFSKIKTYLDSNPYGYVSKSGDTMTGNLTAPKFIGALQGNADTATSASKLGSSNVGSATHPIYLNGGTATACTCTLGKSVPSDAVFTDTKNTAGSTDTSSKIFLIGATSQAANPQTYSHDTTYVGTDGCLYSGGTKVLTAHQSVTDNNPTLSWGTKSKVATIGGTAINVTMPSNPNTDANVTQTATDASSNAEYEILFSETADNTTRTEGARKTSQFTFNPQTNQVTAGHFTAESSSPSGNKTASLVSYDVQLGGTSNTWDGTHTSLKDAIANRVSKAGDTISGDLDFAGGNVFLRTPNSSSDDSGDIAFYYGNGAEKCRIWTNNEYTAAAGPNYRVYKKDGSALYSGRLATMADLSWNNISGKPSYLPTAGGTMTGIEYSSYGSATWVNSLTKSSITLTDDIGFGGWICGPTKNGRIAIATYKNGDDVLYFGYGERGRTTNSYTRRAYWNGANGMFASTVVLGESMLRSSYIGRNDSGDSGYINHVNTGNTAYAPTRASAFTTMSCKYTKTNVVDISEEDALKLLDIRPVNFDYIEEVGGQKDQIGVLAEDTYEILPKVVSVPDDYVEEDFDISKGIHQPLPSVDYAKFVPYLIKLVQMQQKEIDILKKERT